MQILTDTQSIKHTSRGDKGDFNECSEQESRVVVLFDLISFLYSVSRSKRIPDIYFNPEETDYS